MRRARVGPLEAKFATYEAEKLAIDLAHAPEEAEPELRNAVKETARDLRELWRRNARKTARKHGKYYPRAISFDMYPGRLAAEVGPDAHHPKGQGAMSFEYGSRNQPPHLDGNRALDELEPLFVYRATRASEVEL